MSDSFENRVKFERVLWYGAVAILLVISSYFMASNFIFFGFLCGGAGALLLLPYHAVMSVYLAVACFSSALILPFFPGRPYLWEFAALLGWSGLVVMVSMHQYSKEAVATLKKHRLILSGVALYCFVLVFLMFVRGFGFRLFGDDMMGGRFYFQQLTCAVFPFLFCLVDLNEKTLLRLFIIQCALSATYIISEFAFAVAPAGFFVILRFFELPGDAAAFSEKTKQFGIRRFQALNVFSQGYILLTLVFFGLKDFVSRKSVFLIPLIALIFGIGMLSGHRYLILIVSVTLLFASYAQKFWRPLNIGVAVASALLSLIIIYQAADKLPLAAQRAVSFLPGIRIHNQAMDDGAGTFATRRILRKVGWDLVPQYLWVGRGFGMARYDFSHLWDPTGITLHVNQGRFYNGVIGLLVNTGLFGFLGMLIFLGAGTILAAKIIRYLRRQGCHDDFSRMCSLIASLWLANVVAFLIFHGDSEFAMKTFALQGGVLIACNRALERRLVAEPTG